MTTSSNQWAFGIPQEIPDHICDPGFQKEKNLVNAWLSLAPGTCLTDISGSLVTIIHPGNGNRNEGPDCKAAVIYRDGQFLRGDVECHLSASDWFQHGHTEDNQYDSIILHVFARWTSAAEKISAPVLVLEKDSPKPFGCTLTRHNKHWNAPAVLDRLALRRWTRSLEHYYSHFDPWDLFTATLLTLSFRILGKGGNEDSFEFLAESVLEMNRRGKPENDLYIWLTVKSKELNWKRKGMRPKHRPQKRFVLAARLARFIQVWRKEYYADMDLFHQEFDSLFDSSRSGIKTELLTNVFYPALAAQALDLRDLKAAELWKRNWLNLTLPYSYGRYVSQFGSVFKSRELKRVSVLQGMKVLEKEFCRPRFCKVCPLKKRYGIVG